MSTIEQKDALPESAHKAGEIRAIARGIGDQKFRSYPPYRPYSKRESAEIAVDALKLAALELEFLDQDYGFDSIVRECKHAIPALEELVKKLE